MKRRHAESTDFEAIHKSIDEVRESLQGILDELEARSVTISETAADEIHVDDQ